MSKGGSCVTKEGHAKRRYDTRRDAKQARAWAMRVLGNDPGQPYRCPVCGYFHVGHYPADPSIREHLRKKHREVQADL